MDQLEIKKREHQDKVTELNNWLLKNHDHPDRNKVWNDKAFHECEINQLSKKLDNLSNGLPELGYSTHMDNYNADIKTINKII